MTEAHVPLSGSTGPLSRLQSLQERTREWAVYIALGFVLVVVYFGAFLGDVKNYLLPAALTLVAVFVIQTLQNIEKSVDTGLSSGSFADMTQATPTLAELVAKDRDVTDIKVIAATGGTTVSNVLPSLLKSSPAKVVQVTLQVIDRDGPFCDTLPGHWCEEVGTTLNRLRKQYADPRVRTTVHAYSHLPAFHGILINDQHLLLGFFGWETGGHEPELSGAQRPHRLYRRGDPGSEQLFDAFEEWFAHAPQQELLRLPEAAAPTPATLAG